MSISIAYLDGERFEKWRSSLDPRTRFRVTRAIQKLEGGDFSDIRSLGDVKHLDGGLFELRIHERSGYRIYFFRDGNSAVIAKAGTKKTQQADIDAARQLKNHYEAVRPSRKGKWR